MDLWGEMTGEGGEGGWKGFGMEQRKIRVGVKEVCYFGKC